MEFVTISDHNTVEGALRIAHEPDTFLSVEGRPSSRRTLCRFTSSSGDWRRAGAAAFLALARAPRSAYALAERVRALDLRRECARIRVAGIPATVVACVSDTLVTTDRSRALAEALGARYVELDLRGGHMWMLGDPGRLAAVVA
ncbi:MAG TPA: hypothetical protein VNC40_01450 [Gaiellaceae bacterium]|nr:hypothetical protein [Gaiellaceae bacterium]